MPVLVPGGAVTPQPIPLSAGYYQKPFPAPTVEVPALLPYQFWFNGFTMGPGTPLELKRINGKDMPVIRTGDSGRPRDHGLFAGLDLMGGNELILEGDLRPDSTSFQHAWEALAAATIAGGVVEAPLYHNLPGYGTLVSMCRVRKRDIPIDITFALGEMAAVTLLFAAIDPRSYSTPTQSQSATPPGTGSGFTFPLTFPLSFGGGSSVGVIQVTNAGNIEARPILTVTGPCRNPSITLVSAESSSNLTFELTMNAGDKLVLGTDLHTATYYTAGSTIGSSRLDSLVAGSQWFTLTPGASILQFFTSDPEPSGELTCESCSAWIV